MSGTYRLTGRTEAGDLAELYEAVLLPTIPVAVKLFLPRTSDPGYARELAETVRRLQPVRHPGLLHVVDVGFVKQRLAVVREDVEGFTLGIALQRLNTKEVLLPPTVALSIVIQLLETVQLAHDAGVVHGAITPGNVLLARDGFPAICDFGALQALLSVPQLKRTFAHRGRSAYRAPEVARGETPTEASDVYSLGAIAYELLTLREPVVPGSGVSTRRETLPPPSRLDRRINSRLDPAIMRALDPAPQRRFRSCGEFAQALRNFLSAGGGLPGAEEVGRFVSELFPNEVSLAAPGPVPFVEPFQLEPVSGAEMEDLHAEEHEASIVQRAPYSRAPTEHEASADTQEAAPGFEAFRPEDYAPDALADDAPAPEPEPASDTRSTDPSHAGPLEQGWDAPPGVLAQKSHRQPGPQGQTSARAGRNPRVKVVEDFSGPPLGDDEPPVPTGRRAAMRPGVPLGGEEPVPPSGRRPALRPGPPLGAEGEPPPSTKRPALRPAQGAGGRGPGQETAILSAGGGTPSAAPKAPEPAAPRQERRGRAEPTEALPAEPRSERRAAPPKAEGRVRSDMAEPAPSDRHLPVHQRFDTVETPRVDAGTRRKRLLFIAGGIAGVGLFMFAVATWRLGLEPVQEPELPRYDPNAPVANGPPPSAANPSALKPITPPRPAPPPDPTARDVEDEDAEEDSPEPGVPPKNQRAFLTLRTNLPANVFIDGAKVRRATPLVNYPVRVGTREIRVVAISTGEQKDFQLRFSRGQHQKLDEQFQPPPTRR
ncbi:protein kinase [Corallococcus macrosporus]|uniref:Protein kinase n=1 Tax=Corallococcus macrosporus TaxID=35 RepID=A0ABS3D2P0_9BACT|nr:serine/threonine-protein kinase [Corallococcus macrosporus]MBN8225903.1 protein kinase [Corallococcus macrosporus]